jgi:hypothetical protein
MSSRARAPSDSPRCAESCPQHPELVLIAELCIQILSEVDANKTAEQRATQEALPAAQSLGDVSKGETSLTPWKVRAAADCFETQTKY